MLKVVLSYSFEYNFYLATFGCFFCVWLLVRLVKLLLFCNCWPFERKSLMEKIGIYDCWNLGPNSSLQKRLVRWGLPPLYKLFSRVLSISDVGLGFFPIMICRIFCLFCIDIYCPTWGKILFVVVIIIDSFILLFYSIS